jgi:hypothetical protein
MHVHGRQWIVEQKNICFLYSIQCTSKANASFLSPTDVDAAFADFGFVAGWEDLCV